MMHRVLAALRHRTVGRRAPTEGRLLIASVLHDQRNLEAHLHARCGARLEVHRDFEELVADICGFTCLARREPSCGHTLRCWTAMFLSESQITMPSLASILAGGPLVQLFDHPNVLLHLCGSRAHAAAPRLPVPRLAVEASRRYCHWAAAAAVKQLRLALLSDEPAAQLPRVFFCSASWVALDERRGSTGWPALRARREADVWSDVADHEFAVRGRALAL
jgi:hypothetical protein